MSAWSLEWVSALLIGVGATLEVATSELLHISACLQLTFSPKSWMDFIGNNLMFFHDVMIMAIIVGILTLVMLIMGGGSIKFMKYTTKLSSSMEVLWIICPLLILMMIGSVSIFILYMQESAFPLFSKSLVITGYQWYWTFEGGEEEGEMYMGESSDMIQNLSTSSSVLLEGGVPTRLLLTGGDVIHCWTLPSLFLKMDAIPGRLNQLSFVFPPTRGEILFGQCSELCGVNHSFMPINVCIY